MDKLSENDSRQYVCDNCLYDCKNKVIGCSAWKENTLKNMKIAIELSNEEIKRLQELSGILVRDAEDAEDAIHIVIENA